MSSISTRTINTALPPFSCIFCCSHPLEEQQLKQDGMMKNAQKIIEGIPTCFGKDPVRKKVYDEV
ncbi:hypothetical protein E2562_014770 [Oryza meyeriana var. granulata]|uniref:Uncharacterized protein n=1 Tax=Oryza meyeriana var. granulata TaxID=110450 RepID=A0A6G1BMC1_9ORYZ|nr:hypothetical protein E2562_014770 [Oryza meyeriana var. granulata]